MKFAYFNVLTTQCNIMPVLALLLGSILLEAVVLLMTPCPHRHSTGWLWGDDIHHPCQGCPPHPPPVSRLLVGLLSFAEQLSSLLLEHQEQGSKSVLLPEDIW